MSLKIVDQPLPDLKLLQPLVFQDQRGSFLEIFHQETYRELGINQPFVQDNLSYSTHDVLRGLHYQHPHAQAKLVIVILGKIFDVAVDLRKGSPTFGRWYGVELSEENHRQLFVPAGFAHGFCVLSADAYVYYKCTDFYAPTAEHTLLWNDPDLGIAWPVKSPILSEKDGRGRRLVECILPE